MKYTKAKVLSDDWKDKTKGVSTRRHNCGGNFKNSLSRFCRFSCNQGSNLLRRCFIDRHQSQSSQRVTMMPALHVIGNDSLVIQSIYRVITKYVSQLPITISPKYFTDLSSVPHQRNFLQSCSLDITNFDQ